MKYWQEYYLATPLINEVLVCAQENENPHDPYAVAETFFGKSDTQTR